VGGGGGGEEVEREGGRRQDGGKDECVCACVRVCVRMRASEGRVHAYVPGALLHWAQLVRTRRAIHVAT